MELLKGLPPWAKGIIVITLLIVLLAVSYYAYKWIVSDPKEEAAKDKGKAITTVSEAKSELSKITSNPKANKLTLPRYTQAQYAAFADIVFNAMSGVGTNGEAVSSVFGKMYNRADVLKLIDAYGIRQLKGPFGFNDGAPANLITHLQDEGIVGDAKFGLRNHNVYFEL